MGKIRIGTRGSRLARKQAALVQEALVQADDGLETEIVILHTKGDKILDKPLAEIGDKGVFVSEFEQAILDGEIDLAVHSAKDLPMRLAEGLTIAAVLPRGDVRDVLVIPEGGRMPLLSRAEMECAEPVRLFDKNNEAMKTVNDSAGKFVIGTGSRRRQQQAMQLWDSIVCENIRGNVDTRLQKLKNSRKDTGEYDRDSDCAAERKIEDTEVSKGNVTGFDGLILAKAGLDRLEILSQYGKAFDFYPLAPERFLPAACQGIIAVEALQGSAAAMLCRKVNDADTELAFLVEREVLDRLSADCSEAAAAWCRQEQDKLILDVMYAGSRERLTCAAETEDVKRAELLHRGLEMARQAAELVKEKSGS